MPATDKGDMKHQDHNKGITERGRMPALRLARGRAIRLLARTGLKGSGPELPHFQTTALESSPAAQFSLSQPEREQGEGELVDQPSLSSPCLFPLFRHEWAFWEGLHSPRQPGSTARRMQAPPQPGISPTRKLRESARNTQTVMEGSGGLCSDSFADQSREGRDAPVGWI